MKRFMILAVMLAGCSTKDDSDPPDGISGMTPLTDNATGCQYLARGAIFGESIIARIAADGKTHMGCNAKVPPTNNGKSDE
jgi:hypothetical protein